MTDSPSIPKGEREAAGSCADRHHLYVGKCPYCHTRLPRPTPPSPSDKGLREAVARIIDPVAWSNFDLFLPGGTELYGSREAVIENAVSIKPSLAKADAILALPALSREGWRWVPERPTEAMLRAGRGAFVDGTHLEALAVWRAMLSASPLPSGMGGSSRDSQATCAPHGPLPVRAPGEGVAE